MKGSKDIDAPWLGWGMVERRGALGDQCWGTARTCEPLGGVHTLPIRFSVYLFVFYRYNGVRTELGHGKSCMSFGKHLGMLWLLGRRRWFFWTASSSSIMHGKRSRIFAAALPHVFVYMLPRSRYWKFAVAAFESLAEPCAKQNGVTPSVFVQVPVRSAVNDCTWTFDDLRYSQLVCLGEQQKATQAWKDPPGSTGTESVFASCSVKTMRRSCSLRAAVCFGFKLWGFTPLRRGRLMFCSCAT